jgi:AraC-like DNA-binding protein
MTAVVPTLIGPRFEALGAANIVLQARARRHTAGIDAGPLSVKGVTRGEVVWEAAGARFRVEPGSWLVLDRGEAYALDIDEAEPVETFVVFYADAFVTDVAGARVAPVEALLEDPSASSWLPVTRRLWHGASRLTAAMRALRALAGAAPDKGELDSGLRGVLDACADLAVEARRERDRLAACRAATRAEVHRRVLKGKAALDERYDEPFDLGMAAGAACLSAHHFHRSFAAVTGSSPYAYVAARRMAKAERLLAETELDVADVCASVGYASLPSFTRAFRRRTGLPPAAWRAQLRNGG